MLPIATGAGTPLEKLEKMIPLISASCASIRTEPAIFSHDRKRLDPAERQTVLGNEHAYRDLFESVIAGGQEDGSFAPELCVQLTALHLLASINALHRWWRPGGTIDGDAVADHIVATTMDGLRPPLR